uniref:MYG1 n=1 Tax=Setaria digitata TaxID=48799 RepID=A0A915PYT3_9BILA
MPKIGTHDGKFHCDEDDFTARRNEMKIGSYCFTYHVKLSRVLEAGYIKDGAECCGKSRSRDKDVLDACNIVVDVGGEYDHTTMRYDHHQKSFNHTMSTLQVMSFSTKLSSAGLIYAHFGKNVISTLLDLTQNDPVIDILFEKIYETFVESIDAIDNGIPQFDGEPRYHLGGTLSSRLSMLNPSWNEDQNIVDERFMMAIKLVGNEFSELLSYLYKSWLPARSHVIDAVNHRFDVDKSGQIFQLEAGGVPWKNHFFLIEKQLHLENDNITYVIYKDNAKGDWRVQAIPFSEKQAFSCRLALPEAWRGLRDADLTKIADIHGCIFVHPTGFIGGNVSMEGALQMAKKSLSLAGKYKG